MRVKCKRYPGKAWALLGFGRWKIVSCLLVLLNCVINFMGKNVNIFLNFMLHEFVKFV